jgi:rRNA maturation protein Nop10
MRAQELPAKDCPHQTLETYGETHAVHHPSRTSPVDKISSYLWTQSCKQKFYAT